MSAAKVVTIDHDPIPALAKAPPHDMVVVRAPGHFRGAAVYLKTAIDISRLVYQRALALRIH